MNKKQKIIIGLLLMIIVGLMIYGTYYLIKNDSSNEDFVFNTGLPVVSPSTDYIDAVEQPIPKVKISSESLPNQTDILTNLDFQDFKKLFQSKQRSILILIKDGCGYCEAFVPEAVQALEEMNLKAYSINLNDLSKSERSKLVDYVYYKGTPTTYIIENGRAIHTFTGYTDKETIAAFVDMFYLRK